MDSRTQTLCSLAFLLTFVPGFPAAAASAPQTIEPGASCTNSSCHTDVGTANLVHPVAADGGACATCHQPEGAASHHAFKLVADPPALCYTCHADWTKGKSTIHPPVAAGMCLFCHDPHQSANQHLLKFPIEKLCTTCHADKPFTGDKVTHGPVAKGRCIECHRPHSGDLDHLLRAEQPALCFKCHDRVQKRPDGRRIDALKEKFDDQKMSHHVPFEAGTCTVCHLPHAGPNTALLNAPYPASFYAPFSQEAYVCFNCHDATAFAQPRTMDATEFRNGNLNLHYRHVNRAKGRTCRACHAPHAGKYPKLIRERIPFGKRYISIDEFTLTATGGSCAPTCHPKVRYDRFAPEPPPFRTTEREGKDATPAALAAARKAQMPVSEKDQEAATKGPAAKSAPASAAP